MSDDERYQIIGKVVSDHEEAKKHLAAIKAKGKTLAEFLYMTGSALCDEASWSAVGNIITVKRFNTGGTATVAWPTAESLIAVLQEIADTKAKILTLEQQRKELGV